MDTTAAIAISSFVICGWPLVWFALGWFLARRGWPIEVRWRGWRDRDEDDL